MFMPVNNGQAFLQYVPVFTLVYNLQGFPDFLSDDI